MLCGNHRAAEAGEVVAPSASVMLVTLQRNTHSERAHGPSDNQQRRSAAGQACSLVAEYKLGYDVVLGEVVLVGGLPECQCWCSFLFLGPLPGARP